MRKVSVSFLSLVAILLLSACESGRIAVDERVPILSKDYCFIRAGDSALIIGYLNPGDTVKFLSTTFPKDCKMYEVRLPDGRTGWVSSGPVTELLNPAWQPTSSKPPPNYEWPFVVGYLLLIVAGWIGVDAVIYFRRKAASEKTPPGRYVRLIAGFCVLVLGMYLFLSSLSHFLSK
jgi:hypothetical protein